MMFYNNELYFYPFFPKINTLDNRPPTVYSLLESIVNYGKDDKQKIKDLAKYGRSTFFDFDYPLSENVDKEQFECMILNHFLMRRIGFETFRAFNIQLNVRINEIMPKYNKMFNMLDNWNIFEDGEKTIREGFDNRTNETTNSLENNSNSSTQNISDRRNSNTPQNELENVRDGNYVTNYNYDTNNNTGEDHSTTQGSSNTKDNTNYKETITRTQADKLSLYKEYQLEFL